jgi:hypothetical protein
MADMVKLVSRVVLKGKIADVWREITKTDEPQLAMFAHTMKFTAYDDPYCRVTGKAMRQGGDFIAATLKAVIETGRPPVLTRMISALFSVLAPVMTPAKSRSEHWPLKGATRG